MDSPCWDSVQRSWFLRDGETGLHSFIRLAYHNATGPSKGQLGEVRTMFRPNGGPWTTLVTNAEQWVGRAASNLLRHAYAMLRLPYLEPKLPPTKSRSRMRMYLHNVPTGCLSCKSRTWYLGLTPDDPYVQQVTAYRLTLRQSMLTQICSV